MQDKLEKILNIKIDAINKNIDNLNYLNEELDKNNENLDYIKGMILLFKNNEILNFDKISKDDFEKILLMIDPSISDIFRSKTCSYEGIIYIIEGIRKSISLELTEEQNKAILSFIEGMRMKSLNLEDVIANLNESKNRLPEIELNVLSNMLEKYQEIVSKLDNSKYLVEIDEIEDALEFAEISIEEKADVLEFILKYNADIYLKESEKDDEINDEQKEESIELPVFHYEPIDINADINDDLNTTDSDINNDNIKLETPEINNFDIENNENDIEDHNKINDLEKSPSLEEIKFNLDKMYMDLDNLKDDDEKTKQINVVSEEEQTLPPFDDNGFELPVEESKKESVSTPIEINNQFNEIESLEKPVSIPIEVDKPFEEIESNEENHELNTVELEDIIKKIDAKLKEMDKEDTTEKNVSGSLNSLEQPLTENITEEMPIQNSVDYSDILTKYYLPELSIKGKSTEEIDSMLSILNDNKLLDDLKGNKELLTEILNKSSLQKFEEINTIINENLLVKKNEYDYVLEIMFKTMPIVFVKQEAFDSFKENIQFFKEHKLNIINLFDNYRELLIMNNDILRDNYKKAEMYGFEINNENVKYYLYNSHLLENIDYYLEALGYEKGFLGKEEKFDGLEYIKKNPYKLNEINKNTLMKLRYASENNHKIYGKPGILSGEISNPKVDILTLSDDYKNTYFNGEYSFIDRGEIEKTKEEIFNLKEFDLTLDGNINKLDSSYKYDELRYKIGNVLISRIKTIRIYNFLKSKNMSLKNALLVALTYNAVLKINEYDEIKTVVEAIVEGGI